MREIKFRGKTLINMKETWVYGDLMHFDDGDKYIYNKNKMQYNIIENGYQLFPETVGQFTGLKDIDGVEIYEGDIILFTWFTYGVGYEVERETIHKGSIEFIDGSIMFCCEHGKYPLSNLDYNSEMDIEIIGSIHDNPELLGKEE